MTSSLSPSFHDRPPVDEADVYSTSPALHVERVDRSTWRVSDPEIDEYDSRRIVGYIERLSLHHFEVMWLAPPIGWAYVSTFKLALTATSDRAGYDGVVYDERETVFVVSSTLMMRERRRRRPASQN